MVGESGDRWAGDTSRCVTKEHGTMSRDWHSQECEEWGCTIWQWVGLIELLPGLEVNDGGHSVQWMHIHVGETICCDVGSPSDVPDVWGSWAMISRCLTRLG